MRSSRSSWARTSSLAATSFSAMRRMCVSLTSEIPPTDGNTVGGAAVGSNVGVNHGRIEDVDLNTEMQRSYMDYAMSVIVGRALPDVRDGLKPVHRRVLYA